MRKCEESFLIIDESWCEWGDFVFSLRAKLKEKVFDFVLLAIYSKDFVDSMSIQKIY